MSFANISSRLVQRADSFREAHLLFFLVPRLGSADLPFRSTRPNEDRSSGAELMRSDEKVYARPRAISAAFSSQNPWKSTGKCNLFGFQNKSAKCRAGRSQRGTIATIPMNSVEQHASPLRRRYPRYEIDTELHVTTPDERATMRGRSLNISEAGTAGVFVTEWEV